jgi:hypothetical protein
MQLCSFFYVLKYVYLQSLHNISTRLHYPKWSPYSPLIISSSQCGHFIKSWRHSLVWWLSRSLLNIELEHSLHVTLMNGHYASWSLMLIFEPEYPQSLYSLQFTYAYRHCLSWDANSLQLISSLHPSYSYLQMILIVFMTLLNKGDSFLKWLLAQFCKHLCFVLHSEQNTISQPLHWIGLSGILEH